MSKEERRLNLFTQTEKAPPKTLYLQKPKDFEGLISGFKDIKAVSYVASPSSVLSLFDKYKFEHMQLLVGENISVKHYKKDLENKQISFIQRLMHLVKDQKLTVLFPRGKTIHSKFYILSHKDNHRVIVGSANLSETATKAVKQHNYVVYWDLKNGDPLLEKFIEDYKAHLKNARLFLEDLIKLTETRDEEEERIIRTWLSQDVGEVKDLVESETAKVFTDLTRQTLQTIQGREDIGREEEIEEQTETGEVRVIIPSDTRTQNGIEKKLQPLKPSIAKSELRLKAKDFSDYVKKSCGVPLLGVDRSKGIVSLHMGEFNDILTKDTYSQEEVNQGLEYIEKYIESYKFGESIDEQRIQTNVFEALLYVLQAPFAHEFKKMKKQVDMYSRGPSYLYLYGPSFNGKTNFLRFCLKLITGKHLEPIAQDYFNKTRIMSAKMFGTVFPLMFDDVNIGSGSTIEGVLKNYWEVWWNPEHPAPQIIMTTNRFNPPEWANTRIKRINFDVKFDQKDIKASETLNQILTTDCDFFKLFSSSYMQKLNQPIDSIKKDLLVDELSLGRKIFTEFYEFAERSIPEYFPQVPVDKIYDIDKMEWLELFETNVLSQEEHANKLFVHADKTVHTYEVEKFMRLLPQGVKAKRKGHTIIIEGKEKYLEWIASGRQRKSFWNRLADRFRSQKAK